MLRFLPIDTEYEFFFWKTYYDEFSIRYYWVPNTYYNIYYNDNLVGVCGLHKLNKPGSFLMRGDYILSEHRQKKLYVEGKSIHHHSIDFRINTASNLGAKTLWVRCNKNSIKNYKEHGFKLVVNNGKQYLPLCLDLTD
jgi:hypothetical protein